MRNEPIRILHVVGGMNIGGVENWLMSILRNIDRDRFHMDFLVHTTRKCAFDDEIRQLGSKTIPCVPPSRPWQYASRFREIVREHGPYDVVHSHVYWFSGYVVRLSFRAGIPRRLAHMYPVQDLKGQGLVRHLYRKKMCAWIAKYATAVLADSQAALTAVGQECRLDSIPQAVIHPVVDLSPFVRTVDRQDIRQKYGLPRDLPTVIYVARFVPHKEHQGLLDIAQQVNAHGTIAHFVSAGSRGPVLPMLQEAALSRTDLSILADVEDISELMMASDIFVFPSRHEGFGIVALEAQAAGLPVVAARLPSIGEALAPGMKALMFAPDRMDEAAQAIEALLAEPTLRARLAQEGREWVQNFDLISSISQVTRLYAE